MSFDQQPAETQLWRAAIGHIDRSDEAAFSMAAAFAHLNIAPLPSDFSRDKPDAYPCPRFLHRLNLFYVSGPVSPGVLVKRFGAL